MNTQKQHQFSEVRKSSMLFLQLGLVLALLIVYLALEFNSEKEINLYDNNLPMMKPYLLLMIIRQLY